MVIGATTVARADSTVGPGECGQADSGCGCTQTFCNPPSHDLSTPPLPDLSAPRDLQSPPDACREQLRRRHRAHGRGLVLLSGLSALALIALRRRYKTMRPTPAESALAASDTRSDS